MFRSRMCQGAFFKVASDLGCSPKHFPLNVWSTAMKMFREIAVAGLMVISSFAIAEDGSERSQRMNDEFRAKQQELKEHRAWHEAERVREEKIGSVSAMPSGTRTGGN